MSSIEEMFFTNVFFMFFIIGYKTCFLMFFILTSMFFTTMVLDDVGLQSHATNSLAHKTILMSLLGLSDACYKYIFKPMDETSKVSSFSVSNHQTRRRNETIIKTLVFNTHFLLVHSFTE